MASAFEPVPAHFAVMLLAAGAITAAAAATAAANITAAPFESDQLALSVSVSLLD